METFIRNDHLIHYQHANRRRSHRSFALPRSEFKPK
ncbi:MAG: hypothetical protein RLZZ338_91 [Cyanobacteriota bacterium]|jgi:hypothetical protein